MSIGEAPKRFTWDASRLALVVIDMTGHTTREGGLGAALDDVGIESSYYFDRVESTVVPTIGTLLDKFRTVGAAIALTRVLIENDDASDWPAAYRQEVVDLGLAPSRPGVPAFDIRAEFTPRSGEFVVDKRSVSAFCGTALARDLRACGVDHVVLAGCTTNFGVGVSAIDAANQGFEVTVVEDGCAALSPDAHEIWLRMHSLFLERLQAAEVLRRL